MTQPDNDQSVTIRPVVGGDLEDLYAIARHPDVARSKLSLPSMELGEMEAWLRERAPHQHRLAGVVNGRAAGTLSLVQNQRPRLTHSAQLELMVHPDFWNRGLESALLEAAIDLADNWLNLRRLELGVLARDTGTCHLAEAFGFVREGTRRDAVFGDGRYQDQHIMARLPDPPSVSIAAPPAPAARHADVTAVSIRPMLEADAPALHAIFTHPAVARGTLQMPSMELAAVVQRIADRRPGLYRYTAVARHADGSEAVAGSATLHQPQNPRLLHSAGLGLAVHPAYWGVGVGTKLMLALLELSDNWLGLYRLELDVMSDNPVAIHLYERLGFVREGTRRAHSYGDGRWADAHFMARLHPRATSHARTAV